MATCRKRGDKALHFVSNFPITAKKYLINKHIKGQYNGSIIVRPVGTTIALISLTLAILDHNMVYTKRQCLVYVYIDHTQNRKDIHYL